MFVGASLKVIPSWRLGPAHRLRARSLQCAAAGQLSSAGAGSSPSSLRSLNSAVSHSRFSKGPSSSSARPPHYPRPVIPQRNLPACFQLERLPDLRGLVGEHVLELLLLLTEHLDLALAVRNVFLQVARNVLLKIKIAVGSKLTSSLERWPFKEPSCCWRAWAEAAAMLDLYCEFILNYWALAVYFLSIHLKENPSFKLDKLVADNANQAESPESHKDN